MTRPADWTAPKGAVWVCSACGKTAPARDGGRGADPMWDESCFLNAVLCEAGSLVWGENGRVMNARAATSGEVERVEGPI